MKDAREEGIVSACSCRFFCGSHSITDRTTASYFPQAQAMLTVAHFEEVTQRFLQLQALR